MARYSSVALSYLLSSSYHYYATTAWTYSPVPPLTTVPRSGGSRRSRPPPSRSSSSSSLRMSLGGIESSSLGGGGDVGFVDLLPSVGETFTGTGAASSSSSPSAGAGVGSFSLDPILSALRAPLTVITEAERALKEMRGAAVSNAAGAPAGAAGGIGSYVDGIVGGAAGAGAAGGISAESMRGAAGAIVGGAAGALGAVDSALLSDPTIGPVLAQLRGRLADALTTLGVPDPATELSALPPAIQLVTSAVLSYALISSVLGGGFGNAPAPSRPYPLGRYDPYSARAYFDSRPAEAVGRALEIASLSAGFGLGILRDYIGDELDTNSDLRATELSALLTRLGPTFIKVGQSLSIRTDLLSPAYVRGLRSLQDQVPPFPTAEARGILEEELGRKVEDVFEEFGDEPVAAASLGQVYKARLRDDGREVAIKVQRPDIANQIALDMHLLREFAPWAKRTFNLNTDTVGTVDAWGSGFADELDYISEARNAETFDGSIRGTPLAGVVFSPPVVEELTTGRVLTTEWVDGERLDRSSSEDVTILCSIAMNTYLTMMLETGVLHCDPHPGNLLRTPDGRLCILDWGMVTRLDPDLQITLIEHMAHLTSRDYDEIPRDLLLLGFIPQNKAGLIRDSGIVEVLADIYGAWTEGGGAAAVDVNKVVSQLQDLTATRGNLFQIPPYFAYIAKSFSVLEGIGLSNDPKYSIIDECLPYVSKRLLTDKSERTGGALSTFIFGPDKYDIDGRIIDYDRVEQLITGFGSYTTSSSGALLGSGGDRTRAQLVNDLADQILDLLATEEETPLQAIFVEQLAKIISSSTRSIWSQIRERSGRLPSGRTVLGTVVDPLGLFRSSPVVRMNELDERTVETTRDLIRLAQSRLRADGENPVALEASSLTPGEVTELSTVLINKVWERRRGIMKTSNRLATALLKITADKLERGERDGGGRGGGGGAGSGGDTSKGGGGARVATEAEGARGGGA